MNFTDIASRYERDSLVQKPAADRLISLLAIGRGDDVLDLGCGSGSLTNKLRAMTEGMVTAVDPAEGMIHEAKAMYGRDAIVFRVARAEDLAYTGDFTVIFCNSAFQWIREPAKALAACYRALRPGGRMGIQAPATLNYCPNFLKALDAVARDPRTAKTFSGFTPPWIFFDTAEEYAALFRGAGFVVPFAAIETVTTRHSADEAMAVFESGAAAGYLNADHYGTAFTGEYAAAFREIVARSFRKQADGTGRVALTFNRIYLVAGKHAHDRV
jgi:trans-aconitate methyltransferase